VAEIVVDFEGGGHEAVALVFEGEVGFWETFGVHGVSWGWFWFFAGGGICGCGWLGGGGFGGGREA
jgi:hypothetical protein